MSGGDDAWRATRARLMADQQLGEAIAQTYQPLSWAESVRLRAREAAWQHERASLLVDFDVESHIADVEAAERARRAGCGR